MNKGFSHTLQKLQEIKAEFNSAAAQQKLLLIEKLSRQKPYSAKSLKGAHDVLLFIRAFPDSRKILESATNGLQRIKHFLYAYSRSKSLINSGLEFTVLSWKPSRHALLWLLRHSKDLHYTVNSKKKMEELTALLCFKTEWVSLLDIRISFAEWMKQLTGNQQKGTAMALKNWLCRFEKPNTEPPILDYLFDSLSMKITCSVFGNSSITSNSILTGQYHFYSQKPELKPHEKLSPVNIKGKVSESILNSIKAALYARQKETDPVTYADERFLIGVKTEDGFTVYLLSMKPEYRLPLESYIGFMVYSNGIPVSYGGAWIFYTRCEFGINIFEQFRGGPSARILNLLMNTYSHLYGIKTFLIPPYQFGAGNREGIKSAAFWFYYKMGFRPEDKNLKLLAMREWNKRQSRKTYRTPEKTLLRFTESHLVTEQDNNPRPVPDLKILSHSAVKWMAEKAESEKKEIHQMRCRSFSEKSRNNSKRVERSRKEIFSGAVSFCLYDTRLGKMVPVRVKTGCHDVEGERKQ